MVPVPRWSRPRPDDLLVAGRDAARTDVDPRRRQHAVVDLDRRLVPFPPPIGPATGRRRRCRRLRLRPASRPFCSYPLLSCSSLDSPFGPGSSSQKVVPSPGSLSKPMLPPCASTISRETARPRPVPVMPVAPASPRKNFVKMRLCCSSGIPRPSSCTAIRTPPPLRAATSWTVPPSGEYLIAFESRLPTTCASRPGSPRTVSGRSASSTASRCFGLCAAYSCACSSRRLARSTFSVVQVDALVLDPLDVEEVLEQRGQPACLRVDDAEVVPPRRRVELALEQERREPEHARERRPQLVRDDADELGLPALALAQLLVLLLELVRGVTSSRSAISLNARVSSPTSPGPSSGSRSESSPPAIRPAPSATARTGRPIERASTIPKSAISAIEAPDCDGADEHGDVRALVCVACGFGGELVLLRRETAGRAGGSRPSARLPFCASVASFLLRPGHLLQDRDQLRDEREGVLPNLVLDLPCLVPLARIVPDQGRPDRPAAGPACRSRACTPCSESLLPVTAKLRKFDSTSDTIRSSCSDAAVTSLERVSRSAASRCAETARMSAVNAAPTSSASAALASHIRRASVTRAAPRRRS